MAKNNSIDIMLPYWGDFGLLKKTVESVLAQTSDAWHLTVIDDCYPSDEARKYFADLKDPRVTYIRHKKNIGITNNFNYSVEAAKADYCTILGCDDILLPSYVETALSHIGDADFYQPGVEVIDSNGQIYLPFVDRIKRILQPKQSGAYSGEFLATSLCRGNWLYFPSIVWKTTSLKRYRFDPDYKVTQDVFVELNLIKDGGVLYFDKTPTFQYRRFAESMSSKEKKSGGVRFDEENRVYDYFAKKFSEVGWKRAARTAHHRLISRSHQFLSRFA